MNEINVYAQRVLTKRIKSVYSRKVTANRDNNEALLWVPPCKLSFFCVRCQFHLRKEISARFALGHELRKTT